MKALRLAIALLLLGAPFASHAGSITEPLVFDFEDGLQGWELFGSAQRVQTQLLGGQWAIFGDGFIQGEVSPLLGDSFISFPVSDLEGVASVSAEVLFLDGAEGLTLATSGVDGFFRSLVQIPFEPIGAGGAIWTAEVISLGDLVGISISWKRLSADQAVFGPDLSEPVVAFIDNITFHPVPEPSTLVLVGLSLVGVAGSRRRVR